MDGLIETAAPGHATVSTPEVGGADTAAAATGDRRAPIWLKVLAPLAVLALGGAGTYALVATRPEPTAAPRRETVWTVEARRVSRQTVRPQLEAFGRVTAVNPIEIRAGVAGDIAAVGHGLRRGARVATGDLLARIDQRDLELMVRDARAALAEATARAEETAAALARLDGLLAIDRRLVAIAERNFQRRQRLQARGVTSEDALDAAASEAETARRVVTDRAGDVAIQRARLDQHKAAVERAETTLARAERDLARTEIRAPAAGIIETTAVNRGGRVNVNALVATLLPLDGFEAEVRLSAVEYRRLAADDQPVIGRAVALSWVGAGADGGVDLTGRIVRVDPRIDAVGGGITGHVALPALPPDTPLRPGAFLAVSLPDAAFTDVVRLPVTAVMPDGNVYLVGADDRLAGAPAEVVRRLGNEVLLRVSVPDGACVVTTRFNQIGDGVKVVADGCGSAGAGTDADVGGAAS